MSAPNRQIRDTLAKLVALYPKKAVVANANFTFSRGWALIAKLEQAAELGRIEREASQVRQQALDLSGDLAAARQERDRRCHP